MDRELTKKEKRLMQWKRWRKAIVAVAVIIVATGAAIRFTGRSVQLKDLKLATVETGNIETSISTGGKVVPEYQEIITSPISTRILKVYKKSGDEVEAGTPLLLLDLQAAETEYRKELDDEQMRRYRLEQLRMNQSTRLTDLRMKIRVAQMALGSKRMQLRNERYLDSIGSGTSDKVRQAEFDVNTSQLELEQLQKQLANEIKSAEAEYKVQELDLTMFRKSLAETKRVLNDAKIRAPRKAVLTYINSSIGAQVGAGEQVAVVSDLSTFKVECDIADGYANRLSVGGRVVVRTSHQQLSGIISQVNPLTRNGGVEFTVRLDDAGNRHLRSGLQVSVYVLTSEKTGVLRLANGNYYQGEGEYQLFVMEGSRRLVRRDVRLGESSYDYVEVISGLHEGDRVVISDTEAFKSRKEVRIEK